MRAFSELQPGDLFLWRSATWRKIYPKVNTDKASKPHYNAVKLDTPPDESPVFTTILGWYVVIEPSDVEELAPATGEGPCRNGHVFTWTSTTTAGHVSPPQGLPCACGQMSYNAIKVAP